MDQVQDKKECLTTEMPIRQRDHWGIHIWGFIHTITLMDFDDPETTLRLSEPVIKSLKELKLPCHHCQKHYDNYVNETLHLVNLSKSMELFKWGWELHNRINRKLNKMEIGYDTAVALWGKEL